MVKFDEHLDVIFSEGTLVIPNALDLTLCRVINTLDDSPHVWVEVLSTGEGKLLDRTSYSGFKCPIVALDITDPLEFYDLHRLPKQKKAYLKRLKNNAAKP